MILKEFLKRLVFKHRYNSDTYVDYLRKLGMNIGLRTCFFNPRNTIIDETRPWLIEIGDDVQITDNVTILTHGYDWAVLKGYYGEILGSSGKVRIGNNVFIGTGTTILKGVNIGDNVIIGAGSLINKDVPSNSVAVGNPVRIVSDLESYYYKRKQAQLLEARELVVEYFKRHGKIPPKGELSEFFWLFTSSNDDLDKQWIDKLNLVGNFDISIELLKNNEKHFDSYDKFIEWCFIEMGK